MKGLKLLDGDLSIENNEIEIIEGSELIRQTIQSVLSTNKGEWLFDENEGIDFGNILGKHQVKTTSAKDTFYQEEIASMKQDDSELAEKLRRRLDGE